VLNHPSAERSRSTGALGKTNYCSANSDRSENQLKLANSISRLQGPEDESNDRANDGYSRNQYGWKAIGSFKFHNASI
jgi:hypothetical protein